MTAALGERTTAGATTPEGDGREAAVRAGVLAALGRPGGLSRVAVRRVWGDRYRVNVYVGADAASLVVAHSFFVAADAAGAILSSSPPIHRAY